MALPRTIRRRVAPIEAGVPQTFDGQVGASGDDGRRWNGSFNSGGNNENLGKAFGNVHQPFYRFTNVTIPQGATIDDAKIIVTARFTGADGAQKTDIHLEAADDPTAPTTAADADGRTRTTASTAWDDEDFVIDAETDSPDITSVIQEVTDRGGWISGQAMLILWDDDGSANGNYCQPWSWDGDTAKALQLHVGFTA